MKVMIITATFAFGMKAHAQFAYVDSAEKTEILLEDSEDLNPTYPILRFFSETTYRKVFANENQVSKWLQGKQVSQFEFLDFSIEIKIPMQIGDVATIETIGSEDDKLRNYAINNIEHLEEGHTFIEVTDECNNPLVFLVAPSFLDEKEKFWTTEVAVVQPIEEGKFKVTVCKYYQDVEKGD